MSKTEQQFILLDDERNRIIQQFVREALEPSISGLRADSLKLLQTAGASVEGAKDSLISRSNELIKELRSRMATVEASLAEHINELSGHLAELGRFPGATLEIFRGQIAYHFDLLGKSLLEKIPEARRELESYLTSRWEARFQELAAMLAKDLQDFAGLAESTRQLPELLQASLADGFHQLQQQIVELRSEQEINSRDLVTTLDSKVGTLLTSGEAQIRAQTASLAEMHEDSRRRAEVAYEVMGKKVSSLAEWIPVDIEARLSPRFANLEEAASHQQSDLEDARKMWSEQVRVLIDRQDAGRSSTIQTITTAFESSSKLMDETIGLNTRVLKAAVEAAQNGIESLVTKGIFSISTEVAAGFRSTAAEAEARAQSMIASVEAMDLTWHSRLDEMKSIIMNRLELASNTAEALLVEEQKRVEAAQALFRAQAAEIHQQVLANKIELESLGRLVRAEIRQTQANQEAQWQGLISTLLAQSRVETRRFYIILTFLILLGVILLALHR